MNPIRFSCTATFPIPAEQIAAQILDVARWADFEGYGPLPAIRSAAFEVRTPEIVGSRIRVVNMDGSTHVEEITHWEPSRRLELHMSGFSKPLASLATGFDEVWEFEVEGEGTRAVRSFTLHGRSALTRPLLWVIARLLRGAVERHMRRLTGA